MARLRVQSFSISLDGFGAGPSQDRVNPLGVGGEALHEWQVPTRSFRQEHGDKAGGTTGVDDDFVARAFKGIGAWIMGRNMFGPIRGQLPDDSCTEYRFVTTGIHHALEQAMAATGEHLFAGIDLPKLGYQLTEHVPSAAATHVVFSKR